MRRMSSNFLSVDDVLSGMVMLNGSGFTKFEFEGNALREFTDGVCDALNMRDKDDVFENIVFDRVKNCGIIERIGFQFTTKNCISSI